MAVFMAGQAKRGLEKSQARSKHESKLSQMPVAAFAIVLASRGAMMRTSAHLRS